MNSIREDVLEFYSKLNQFREEEKFTDVTFECESTSFSCHRLVLTVASPYFEAMFGNNSFKESSSDRIVLQEISSSTFEEVLRFMYTGNVNVTASNLLDLLRASDFYSLPRIKNFCVNFLLDKNQVTVLNVFPVFLYACHTNKNDLVCVLSSLISERFSVYCKFKEFLDISFDHLKIILDQYLLSLSRNEESLLTAVMRWIYHDRQDRLKYLDEFLGMIRFGNISSEYFKYITRKFITEEDPAMAFKRPLDYDSVPELQRNKILRASKSLYTYVRYSNERLIRIFAINEDEECTNFDEFKITDKQTSIRCAVSDDSYLYCLNFLQTIPDVQEIGNQTFCAHTSVDRCTSTTLTPPPVVFSRVSLCYLQSNIYAYDVNIGLNSVIRTDSTSCSSFNDEEIKRGMYIYNCNSDNWFPIPQMNKIQRNACMTVCDNSLFLIGGWSPAGNTKQTLAFDSRVGWREVASSKYDHSGADCCSLNGVIYVCGGKYDGSKTAERYDLVAGKWETIQPMETSAIFHRLIPFNNKLWVMGRIFRSDKTSVDIYDPTENQWYESSILSDATAEFIVKPSSVLEGIVF